MDGRNLERPCASLILPRGCGNSISQQIHCARNCTNGVLEEAKAFAERSVSFRENNSTHNDIGMTIDVFRKTMEDDIGTLK